MLIGYKTYIVGTLAILTAIGAYLTGDANLPDTIQLVVTGLIGMTLKAGQARQ